MPSQSHRGDSAGKFGWGWPRRARMFGIDIPGWAIGVGVIILATSLGGALKRLIGGEPSPRLSRGKPPSRRALGALVEDEASKMCEADELRSRLGGLEAMQRRLGEVE